MTLIKNFFMAAQINEKVSLLAFLLLLLGTFILFIAYLRKRSVLSKLEAKLKPYKVWEKYPAEDGTPWYAIPISTKLFKETDSVKFKFEAVGTVLENINYFLVDFSLSELVDEYFYGNLPTRHAVFAKIVGVSANSKYLYIETQLGEVFVVQRPKTLSCIEVCCCKKD